MKKGNCIEHFVKGKQNVHFIVESNQNYKRQISMLLIAIYHFRIAYTNKLVLIHIKISY